MRTLHALSDVRGSMQRGPRPVSGPVEGRYRWPLIAVALAVLLTLYACGGGGSKGGNGGDTGLHLTKPNVAANDAVRDGGSVTMALEKDVPNFNPISSDGTSLEGQMVVNGIFPATYLQLPDFTVRMNSDLLDSAQVTKAS